MALVASNGDEGSLPSSLLELLSPTPTNPDALDLSSPAAKAYIDRLITLGLDNLVQEPGIIDHERSAVDLELVNLCYREYPTFTSVHKCSSAVGAAFDDFANSLGQLIESIPALEEECRQFGRGTSSIQSARRKAVLLQDHEGKLMDVLEIPQLMETCVRNGYYQEALELSAHVADLRQRYNTTVVDDVAEETSSILQLMTAQLLGILREPVKLPALLKAVGYLRRLQDLDESQLGLVFLSSRLQNYRARLVEIEKDRAEPVRYLRRYIDLFREHVFDIISQYTTIFSAVAGDQLASFVSLCVEDLTQLVQRYIPRIASDSASMSSILVQLGYCSLSFARAGLDFSSLLVDPFKSSILHSYDQAVASAASLLIETLALDSQGAAAPANLVISAQHLQQVLVDPYSPPRHDNAHSDAHTPPANLAHFPLLAHFLNAHLTSLNALRLLAPFQCMSSLLASQSKSVQQATAAILDYCEQAVSTETSGDLSRTGSRSRHTRTNSTPRAHLIRRNTETQLSVETLTAKRRETKRVCVAFADAWVTACSFLQQALGLILEMDPASGRSADAINQLRLWIAENGEKEIDDEVPAPAPEPNGDRVEPMVEIDEVAEVNDQPTRNGHTNGPLAYPAEVASTRPDTPANLVGHSADPKHIDGSLAIHEAPQSEIPRQLEALEVPSEPATIEAAQTETLHRLEAPEQSPQPVPPQAPQNETPSQVEVSEVPPDPATTEDTQRGIQPQLEVPDISSETAPPSSSSLPTDRDLSVPGIATTSEDVNVEEGAPVPDDQTLPTLAPIVSDRSDEQAVLSQATAPQSVNPDPIGPADTGTTSFEFGQSSVPPSDPEAGPDTGSLHVADPIVQLESTLSSAEEPAASRDMRPETTPRSALSRHESPSMEDPIPAPNLAPESVTPDNVLSRAQSPSIHDSASNPNVPETATPDGEERDGDEPDQEITQAWQGGGGAKPGKKKKKKKGKK